MRKFLLVVAMLVFVVPAMATVSVTAINKGGGVVEVGFSCSPYEKVRIFALDINVDNGLTIDNIRDFNRGESKVPGGGYGMFPGTFAGLINPADPNWGETNYIPVAPAGDPNITKSGLGTNAITVELGALYVDTNAPGASGLLFRLDINAHGANYGNLSIALNEARKGIVLESGYLAQSPILTGTVIPFNDLVPNIVGGSCVEGDSALIDAGFTTAVEYRCSNVIPAGIVMSQNPVGGSTVEPGSQVSYICSLGIQPLIPSQLIYPTYDPDCNLPIYWSQAPGAAVYELDRSNDGGSAWANVYTGTATFNVESVDPGIYRYRVRASNEDANGDYKTSTVDCNAYLSTCYRNGNTADPNWDNWVQVGRPDCWCKAVASTVGDPNGSGYQCDGDADGAAYGGNPATALRIYTGDLSMLSYNWKKTTGQITADANVVLAGKLKIHAACADIDHRAYGGNPTTALRIYTGDLSIVSSNWKKKNSSTVMATNRLPGNCPR